jgi:hypothetical protein
LDAKIESLGVEEQNVGAFQTEVQTQMDITLLNGKAGPVAWKKLEN